MDTKNSMHTEDNLGLFKGLASAAFIYAIGFAIYNLGYGSGRESAKCKERHSYHYKNVTWFNGARK